MRVFVSVLFPPQVIGDKSDVSYDDTSKVKILDNCIKEAMRLYPAAPLIGRRCIKDDKIGPYVIPANTELFIDLGSLFRSEERWKRPDDYNPDRFNEKGRFWLFSSVGNLAIGHEIKLVPMGGGGSFIVKVPGDVPPTRVYFFGPLV